MTCPALNRLDATDLDCFQFESTAAFYEWDLSGIGVGDNGIHAKFKYVYGGIFLQKIEKSIPRTIVAFLVMFPTCLRKVS